MTAAERAAEVIDPEVTEPLDCLHIVAALMADPADLADLAVEAGGAAADIGEDR